MRISDWSSDVCSSDLTPQGNTISPQLFNRVNLTDFPFGAPPSRHLAGKKRVEHEMIFGGRATAIMLFISCLIMGGTAAQASQYLQCVTYARQISGVQLSGNANTWRDHAKEIGRASCRESVGQYG